MAHKFGARIYFQGDTIQIKQTVYRNGRYVLDLDEADQEMEDFAEPGPDQAIKILRILNRARKGKLTSKTSMFGRRKTRD